MSVAGGLKGLKLYSGVNSHSRSWTDSNYRAEYLPLSVPRTKTSSPGMEFPQTRLTSTTQLSDPSSKSANMSALTMMRSPMPMLPSPRDVMWDDRRPQERASRPRSVSSQSERIELPSIRQAVPEIQQSVRSETEYRTDSFTHSPTGRLGNPISPPGYIQSSVTHKRRRLSTEDEEAEARERSVPRLYTSPPKLYRTQSGPISPANERSSSIAGSEHWSTSSRNSPYIPARGLQEVRSPPPFDSSSITRADWRPMLPSLPSLPLDRGAPPIQKGRGTWSDSGLESSRYGAQTFSQQQQQQQQPQQQQQHLQFENPNNSYSHPSFSYGYQQPRGQLFAGPPHHHATHDRTPFTNNHAGFPGNYPYGMEPVEPDNKQRKRRGNLPKETTDKLRSWFVAHLQHPYPTEDEKQELMRQTGLQMNQISNWFINARRRQLPAMINNARVESDARSARGGEILRTDLLGDYGGENQERLSDGELEGSGYEEDYEGIARRAKADGA